MIFVKLWFHSERNKNISWSLMSLYFEHVKKCMYTMIIFYLHINNVQNRMKNLQITYDYRTIFLYAFLLIFGIKFRDSTLHTSNTTMKSKSQVRID